MLKAFIYFIKPYSTTNKISPWFITGLTEAEGCFYTNVDKRRKMGINFSFRIEMLSRDYNLLLSVQSYFNCGSIQHNPSKNTYIFGVYSSKDLENNIIPHFDKYPLRGVKFFPRGGKPEGKAPRA